MHRERGASLVELVVVVLVIGVLVSAATAVLVRQQALARVTAARADAAVIHQHLLVHLLGDERPVRVASADGRWALTVDGGPAQAVGDGRLSGSGEVLHGRGQDAQDYCLVVGTGVDGDREVRVTPQGDAVVEAGSTC